MIPRDLCSTFSQAGCPSCHPTTSTGRQSYKTKTLSSNKTYKFSFSFLFAIRLCIKIIKTDGWDRNKTFHLLHIVDMSIFTSFILICKFIAANLSISENFNRMPVSITQWQCRWWTRNHHFSIAKIDSKPWIAADKFNGHEIFPRRWLWDRSCVEQQLTASGRRRHELKTQLVHLIRLQWLQHHIAAITSERQLRLLAARSLKTNWTWTAESRHISDMQS